MRIGFKNIRAKVALNVLLLLLLTILTSYVITSRVMEASVAGEVVKRAESIGRTIAAAAGFSLMSQDLLGLDSIVFKTRATNPDIEYIAIVGLDGKAVVHSDTDKAGVPLVPAVGRVLLKMENSVNLYETPGPAGALFEIENPIVHLDRTLGAVVLGVNKSALAAARAATRRRIIWIFAAILALGVASSVLLSSVLSRPVKQLAAGVEEMKAGVRSRPLHVYSRDELGRLTVSFNEMTSQITAQKDKLSKYARDLEESYVSTVRVLAAAIDARDAYTHGHSTRVSELSVDIAREMGFDAEQIEEVEIACLFHDVGKIKMPDSILHKDGRLDPAERREMMRHPEFGAEILTKAQSLFKYIPAVRHHHEHYDGSGYPDGLEGDRIPVAASIVALADAYDAMTSDRPYRTALSREEAVSRIIQGSGRQFDPKIVEVFLKVLEKIKAEEDKPEK